MRKNQINCKGKAGNVPLAQMLADLKNTKERAYFDIDIADIAERKQVGIYWYEFL